MEIKPPILKENAAVGAMKEPDSGHEMVTFTREELDAFLEFVRGEREFALLWTIAYSARAAARRWDCAGRT